MKYLVYKHTSPSGKSYIGITRDYDARCRMHRSPTSRCVAFRAAVERYGWDNFLHEVLYDNLTKDQALYREQQLIREYGTMVPHGYNLTTGGHMPEFSDTTRAMMSASRKQLVMTEERKRKISETLKGRTMSETRRLKNAKRFIVTPPDGTSQLVVNLHQYCLDHGLHSGSMNRVAHGKLSQYKGWLVTVVRD